MVQGTAAADAQKELLDTWNKSRASNDIKRNTFAAAYGSPQYQYFDTANACGEMSVSYTQDAARYTSCGELEQLTMDEAEKKIIQERIRKEKEKAIPRWDCVDGSKGSVMSQFSIKTLGSMKTSLEKAKNSLENGGKLNKAYLSNYDAKMQYILERMNDDFHYSH